MKYHGAEVSKRAFTLIEMLVNRTSDQDMTTTVTAQGNPMTARMNRKIHVVLVGTEN